MRKTLSVLALAAATTIAVLAGSGSANAAVSYDGDHDGIVTGHVDKSDVQSLLGWNEAKVQSTTVNFSTTFSSWTDQSWTCNNGEVRHNVRTATFDMGLTKTEVRGGAGNKIKGWDLTGMGALTNARSVTTGPRWLDCADAGGVNYSTMLTTQDHALGSDLFVNGVLLPETPVV